MSILAGVVAVVVAVLAVTPVLAPDKATGPAVEARFVSWCHRSGPSDDRCACAYRALLAGLGADRLARLDDELGNRDSLPPDVAPLVSPCTG